MKAIILLVSWIVLVTYLSLAPIGETEISVFPNQDKLVHFVFYFGMSLLAMIAFKTKELKKLFVVIIITVLYGILMEWLQFSMNLGRHFDYFDIIANIIGSLTGSLLVFLLTKKFKLD